MQHKTQTIFLISILFLLTSFSLQAQPNCDTSITRARVDKYYVGSYFKDYRDIVTCPFKPSVKKYTLAAVYGGAMYALISHYDEKIQIYSQDHKSSFVTDASKYVFEPFGRGLYPISAIMLLYAEGVIWKNQKSKKVAMNATKSFIIATSFAQIAKYAFTRQRPLVGPADAHKWEMGGGNASFFRDIPQQHFLLQPFLPKNINRQFGFLLWLILLLQELESREYMTINTGQAMYLLEHYVAI